MTEVSLPRIEINLTKFVVQRKGWHIPFVIPSRSLRGGVWGFEIRLRSLLELPRIVEEIVSRGELLSLYVQRLSTGVLVIAAVRLSNGDARELAERLRTLEGIGSLNVIAEEVRGIWLWSGGGPPMIRDENLILLRRREYMGIQKGAFDRLGSLWEGIIARQMRLYGMNVAKWYKNSVRGSVEDMVRAAALAFKILGLGSITYIRTQRNSYVIEVESWIDPPGKACPSAKSIWQGFLSELVEVDLKAKSIEVAYGEGPICKVTLYP